MTKPPYIRTPRNAARSDLAPATPEQIAELVAYCQQLRKGAFRGAIPYNTVIKRAQSHAERNLNAYVSSRVLSEAWAAANKRKKGE